MDISLSLDAKQVRLEVKDDGRGIPQEHLKRLIEGAAEAGVGIAGMRERTRELGGSLDIQSDRTGTKVVVRIPFVEEASTDSTEKGVSGRRFSAA